MLLAIAVLPVIVLGYYIYSKDVNKEPASILAKIFILGVGTCIPAAIVEGVVGNIFNTDDASIGLVAMFINVFFAVGLEEEVFKWLVAKFCGYNSIEFDEIYDIIVYAVFSSLGFACFENILYVLSSGMQTGIARAVLSVPGHACFGVLMGYFFAKARINKVKNESCVGNLCLSILVPTLFHTMYDALLMAEVNFFIFLAFDIIMVVLCFILVNKVSKWQINIKTNNGMYYYNNMYYAPNMQPSATPMFNNPMYGNNCINQVQNNTGVQMNNSMPMYGQTMNNGINQVPNNTNMQMNNNVPMYGQTMNNVSNNQAVKYCPQCGKQTSGSFCNNCGYKIN